MTGTKPHHKRQKKNSPDEKPVLDEKAVGSDVSMEQEHSEEVKNEKDCSPKVIPILEECLQIISGMSEKPLTEEDIKKLVLFRRIGSLSEQKQCLEALESEKSKLMKKYVLTAGHFPHSYFICVG